MANGVALEEFGPRITDVVKPDFTIVKRSKDALEGEVLYVDDFGNVVTSINARDIAAFGENIVCVELASQKPQQMKVSRTFADEKFQEPLVLVGSHGYVEVALNQGNAAAKFSVTPGNKITIRRIT